MATTNNNVDTINIAVAKAPPKDAANNIIRGLYKRVTQNQELPAFYVSVLINLTGSHYYPSNTVQAHPNPNPSYTPSSCSGEVSKRLAWLARLAQRMSPRLGQIELAKQLRLSDECKIARERPKITS